MFDLFTGMGGCWHALNSLGIPPGESSLIKMLMFETDPVARSVLQAKAKDHPGWLKLSDEEDAAGTKGSVLALTERGFGLLFSILDEYKEVEHVLFAGGSPCQGFSRANPHPRGVGDPRSALIWVFHALPVMASRHLGDRATVAIVLENVVMDSSEIPKNISGLVGVRPQVVNANLWSACDRDRNFWSSYPSLPLPMFNTGDLDVSKILKPGWRPLWELENSHKRKRFSTFLRPFPPERPLENVTGFWKFPLHRYDEHGLVYRPDAPKAILDKIRHFVLSVTRQRSHRPKDANSTGNAGRVELCRWIHEEGNSKFLRPLDADERDLALGFPAGASSPPPSHKPSEHGAEFDRCCLSGNAWSPPAAAHVLTPLARHILDGEPLPVDGVQPNFVSQEETLRFIQPLLKTALPSKGSTTSTPSREPKGGSGRR